MIEINTFSDNLKVRTYGDGCREIIRSKNK